jgi:hypothetical protein
MEQHEFQCGLCDSKKMHDPAKGHVPPGWNMKKINDRVVQICSRCNNPGHWNGGMSPMLKELYGKKFGEKVRDGQ